MRNELNLQEKNENLYVPEPARLIDAKYFSEKEKYFQFELLSGKSLGHVPGQFVQVSLLGIGEAAISISSPPSKDNKFVLCLRAVGDVTNALHALKVGDLVYIRGPFGKGYDDARMKKMENKHLLFICGGTGLFPLHSLIGKVIPERQKYKKISILYGCKTPAERAYVEELDAISKIGENVELFQTVDKPDATWQGNSGVITTLIPKVQVNPEETIAGIVGPPIMYKFVLKSLMDLKIPKENIFMSLERRMKCGVGKCGHCQMGDIYVCQEGPVFNFAEVENTEELF